MIGVWRSRDIGFRPLRYEVLHKPPDLLLLCYLCSCLRRVSATCQSLNGDLANGIQGIHKTAARVLPVTLANFSRTGL